MKKITLLIAVLFFSTYAVFSQSLVKGKITDSKDGSPIGGASIKVKGTSKGTSSNNDGTFSIELPNKEAVLEFSGAGISFSTLKVQAGQEVSVSLDRDTKNLNEVVVTA